MLKVNNRNTRTRGEICSNLTIKIPERRQRRSGIFIVNFEHISHLVLASLLPTLNYRLWSCLKKVNDTVETECGKSFTNVVLWSDGMGAQFRSKFIFQLIAGTMFLNKSLCWFYNERHQGEVPMDDLGETIKNVIFRKIQSGQIVVQTHKEFSGATIKSVPSIITLYLGRSYEIVESESIHQAPSIPKTLSIHKSVRQIND